MAECLKDIGKSIITQCLWPPINEIGRSIITQCLWPPIQSHIDYWWCFDNNIKDLTDGVRDLDRETFHINQKIEEARLRTDKLRPGVEDWSKAGTEKLEEAKRIFEDEINPKAWKLISRYLMGKRAKKAAEEIAKHRNAGNFNEVADPAPPPEMRFTPDTSIMSFQSRERIVEDIIKTLKETSVSMIGICGMGGVGKTTMARRIIERVMEEKEKEKLFDEVVMVVVSQQIDMLKIQKEVAELLGLKFDVETMPARADKLRKRLMDEKRKIVIFDDVWERLKLEDLGVPSGFERCKIILTTRSEDVCKNMRVQKTIPIEILTKEEARILFKRIAGDCVEDSVFHSVVAECKGLPLALVTVGMALQNKEKSNWEDALLQLKRANPTALTEVRIYVYNHLKLSYDYLDNDCERFLFLLCCLFPEDYNIPVEELTLYFMGLRIFDDDDITSIKEARNRIHTLVGNLKSRFLLIDGEGKHHVKMHDVVRDVAIYIGSKVKEPIFIGSKEKNRFLKSLNQISIENSSDINCEWMSVDVSNEPMNVDMGLRFRKLHLLMLLNLSSDTSLEGITDLNVLSFSKMPIGSLASLQNLRTLYLYRCKVEDISVIGKLTGLEILYCHDCDEIKELPAEIGRLNRLRLLNLNECRNLQRIPFGIISSLVRLEELKMLWSFKGWEGEENGKENWNASVRELESLPILSCLEIEISDTNLAAQEIRLSPNLVKYCIAIGCENHSYVWKDKYEKLMKLELPSKIGEVGKWIQNLVKNTECLFLEGDGSNNINLEECQDLRNLQIRECSTLKKVVKTKDCKSGIVFPMLETLRLERLENIEEIWDGTIILNQNNVSSSLSNLKSVVIGRCSKLRYLLSLSVATTCLLLLEVLEITTCPVMEQVFRNDIRDGDGCIQFPKLKKLMLGDLPNLTAFCQGIETIKFPNLTEMSFCNLPRLNSLCPLNSETPHDDANPFHFLCNPKVEIGCLKTLVVNSFDYNNIRNIWCHQIPINFFNNLEELHIYRINGIRSLMPYSIAKNLVSLEHLNITYCEEMVEVIEGNDDDDKQVVDIKCLFPTLKKLEFYFLHKLRSFWQWNLALELPMLETVLIENCPVMETFTLGSLNTPNLKMLDITDRLHDMKDLNDALRHHFFMTKNQNTSMIEVENEDEDEDANEDEGEDKYEDEGERK